MLWLMRSRLDVDALLDFQAQAPAPQLALQTWEHYVRCLTQVLARD
jgi:hypothetical protein